MKRAKTKTEITVATRQRITIRRRSQLDALCDACTASTPRVTLTNCALQVARMTKQKRRMMMIGRRLFSLIAIPAAMFLTAALGHAQDITGSGTTGFLSKFTGTTTIGNSIIRTSGTSVAVGVAPLADWRFYPFSPINIGRVMKNENAPGGRGLLGASPMNLSAIGSHFRLTPSSFSSTSGTLKDRSHAVQWSGSLERNAAPSGEVPECASTPCDRLT